MNIGSTIWYLHDLTDGFKAERVIGDWITFYNTERPHSALAGQTPAEAYATERPVDMMDIQRDLAAIHAFNETLHQTLPTKHGRIIA